MPRLIRALRDHFNVLHLARLAQRRYACERLMAAVPRESLVVICAGMPRSASTWQYNVVVHALRLLGHDDVGGGWIDDLPSFARHAVVIIKTHRYETPIADRADLVFTAYRDPRDVLASSQRCFGHEPRVEHAVAAVAHLERWSMIADHVMRYEDLLERGKPAVVAEMLRAIGGDAATLDARGIADAVEALDADRKADGYDKTSLLHANHRTDGRHGQWSQLPAHVVAGVESQLGAWMRAKGYLPRRVRISRCASKRAA